jgi:SAM-dependent methyltransferase
MNIAPEVRERFLREYALIRHAEGRGSEDSDYYCALPFQDLTGRNAAMWAMRAATFRYFVKHLLAPLERPQNPGLDILDLGAGNCWLSHRLALRNHRPVAVDIFSDEQDGLRAARHYPARFPVLENDFDRLPLASGSFDVAIFNASFHYSTNYFDTLAEVRRCLRPSGLVVILDSPVYRTAEQGELMVAEKREAFVRRYGFPSDALPSREFLDLRTVRDLSAKLSVSWTIHKPWYGWKWHLRPLNSFLRSRRAPSRFWILAGRFQQR